MTDQPWQEWLEPIIDLLSNASDYIGQWFNTYKQLLTTIGIVLLAIISVKIIVAVLEQLVMFLFWLLFCNL